MANIPEIVFAVFFLLFTVLAAFRSRTERRDIEQRNQESDWSADDLPEETRRMLFGDGAPPMAKPADPKREHDPFVQVRDVFNEMRRQAQMQTAKPRQTAPHAPPHASPAQSGAPRQAHPAQPEFRPAQRVPAAGPVVQRHAASPKRPLTPPRHVVTQRPSAPAQPQPPRMVPQLQEGAMRRESAVPQQRSAQQQQRHPKPVPVRVVENEEGPRSPFPAPKRHRRQTEPRKKHDRWFGSPDKIRRGIVISEILGPPRALREFDAG